MKNNPFSKVKRCVQVQVETRHCNKSKLLHSKGKGLLTFASKRSHYFDPTHQSDRNHQALRKATFKKPETGKIKQIFKKISSTDCHARSYPSKILQILFGTASGLVYFSGIGFLLGQPYSLKGCHPRGHASQKLQPASQRNDCDWKQINKPKMFKTHQKQHVSEFLC